MKRKTLLILIALQLAALRTARGLTQNQVAEMLATATGVPTCEMYLLDKEQNILVRRAGTGFQDPARQAFARSLQLNPKRVWTKQQLEKTPVK